MSIGPSPHICAPPGSITRDINYTLSSLPNVMWALYDCPLSSSIQAYTTVEFSLLNNDPSDDTDSFGLSLCCKNASSYDCVDFYRFKGNGTEYYSFGTLPSTTIRNDTATSFCATPTTGLLNCPNEDLRIRFAAGTSAYDTEIIGLRDVIIQCSMEALDGTNCLSPNAYISAPIGDGLELNPPISTWPTSSLCK